MGISDSGSRPARAPSGAQPPIASVAPSSVVAATRPALTARIDFGPTDPFVPRHNGPGLSTDQSAGGGAGDEIANMLAVVGAKSTGALIDATLPENIRLNAELALDAPVAERDMLRILRGIADKNEVLRSLIGTGYYGTALPAVIQRNVLENPSWYTQYTPYQAEIAQGRLEALLNFQTLVSDLCGLPLAGASLLDEATAAAEALSMCVALGRGKRSAFFVSERCHPQTRAVVATRADALGIEVHVGDPHAFDFAAHAVAGALVQTPDTFGRLDDVESIAERVHASGAKLVVATDLLALVEATPPGELGADIAVGSAQRFGIPLGYGGPHGAFLAAGDEWKRVMPGRIIGVSVDRNGGRALRMAMQTREQHIRRDKATSNICTAQVLLAVLSSFYAVYHGPEGLLRMSRRVRALTAGLAKLLEDAGYALEPGPRFDTLRVLSGPRDSASVHAAARAAGFNLRDIDGVTVGVSLDELSTSEEVARVAALFGIDTDAARVEHTAEAEFAPHPGKLARTSKFLEHPVFHAYRTEHEILRYMKRLENRDLSLVHSMIPLGSCTMKLNATSEMLPVTWPEFGNLHPFCPRDQAAGYAELFTRLEAALCELTGFARMSLQPNAGSQGEYAGLLAIRAYHRARGEEHRDACLIPTSAHGTNPASAVMAGMRVVPVACDAHGNIDVDDLAAKAAQHGDKLAALMVTYPSTHGVFESRIKEICATVHEHGGQVYMDGANMNAMVGVCRPGDFGADVCHLNLHKTFCIPHGGGGPGVGPIGVAAHLAPYVPGHPLLDGGNAQVGPVAAAPWGSASILTISWAYITMMGGSGLLAATERAILAANYMAKRLEQHYDVLFRGESGRVAHEFILDLRPFEKSAGVTAEDVAKRLMDYGFHAPTMSWPVAGTVMIEPTESESQAALDRFCDAMISIRTEIRQIENGELTREDNPLVNAPHTAAETTADEWTHTYSREQAAFPAAWTREGKFWPFVARVDNGYGDRNLVCTCPPMESYAEESETREASLSGA